eukprot:TRINITY_DN54725_c0_g1_i1.p1 TRINITY_DN54725_c0_g1~~TRINITY_DN54725_c0_g1_i1.p1  ORF type:complete len:289 (-),score=61.71 TRINITY_DN54725_c0_g1_i1:47-874(-)
MDADRVLDASQRNAILKDPAVQRAIAEAGKDALSSPAVQQQILATCAEKYPELASQAASKLQSWAEDPAFKEQLAGMASRTAAATASAAVAAPGTILRLIEKGEPGVRRIACTCGLVSAAWSFIGVVNVFNILTPIDYIVDMYLCIFGLTTAMFEASPRWVARCDLLKAYQDGLIDNAKFLCKCWGRGMFYIFQGSLWFGQCGIKTPLTLCLALMLCFVGVLNVMLFFGIAPQRAVHGCIDAIKSLWQKPKEDSSGGAQLVELAPTAPLPQGAAV